MIQNAEGIPPDQQRLIYLVKDSEGIQLDRGKDSPLAVW